MPLPYNNALLKANQYHDCTVKRVTLTHVAQHWPIFTHKSKCNTTINMLVKIEGVIYQTYDPYRMIAFPYRYL